MTIAMNGVPLASIDIIDDGKCVVTVYENGGFERTTVSKTQALIMKDLLDQHPDWSVYTAFQYINTTEFKHKLLGHLLGDLKSDLLKDHPAYSN